MTAIEELMIKVWVTGRVQGVGFRYWTQKNAKKLGLKGYANNLADGRVEVCMLGEEGSVHELLALLRKGPPLAKVTDVYWENEHADLNISTFTTG